MKYPLITDDSGIYPKRFICPICKKKKIGEPHSFAYLSGGALKVDKKNKRSIMSESLRGFLSIGWHGAHDGGIGRDRDIYINIEIAQDSSVGQFEFYTCSTHCLRILLNNCINDLEKKISKKRLLSQQSNKQRLTRRSRQKRRRPKPALNLIRPRQTA